MPDSPEALRCMPSLALADIPKRASTVPTALAEEAGVSVLRHELFTNDVLYLEAALDLRPVPPSLLHLVPLFCRCVRPTSSWLLPFLVLPAGHHLLCQRAAFACNAAITLFTAAPLKLGLPGYLMSLYDDSVLSIGVLAGL